MKCELEFRIGLVSAFHPLSKSAYIIASKAGNETREITYHGLSIADLENVSVENVLTGLYAGTNSEDFDVEQVGFVDIPTHSPSVDGPTALRFSQMLYPLIGDKKIYEVRERYAPLLVELFASYASIIPNLSRIEMNSFGFSETHGEKMHSIGKLERFEYDRINKK